ncbi:4Fe-4S dicluster domain-containing protein [Demequina muriae]|uniref:4Fe-4S dicluster domain-containing protein n=1 Tax=Demequina muriae TaxID=3051664 RepID=A0ABT8GED1_9MICO|nr:4Fe-4S dicluster domain-containing protein [Demequina sp. EGI L300058]MDN4479694.1 4Fe-4S dicluster domain-containing protein [Demequina sp. EGI L300058]
MDDIRLLPVTGLEALIAQLRSRGYTVMGPTLRDDAIVTGEIRSASDLPQGVGDEQDPARYRLRKRDDGAYFGFAAPAQSSKPVFFPAHEVIWRGRRDPAAASTGAASTSATTTATTSTHDPGFTVERDQLDAPPIALLGVRSCDLRAVQIHDKVLAGRTYIDAHYVTRREATFVVAVACSDPAATCFCASMGTGPRPAATDPATGEPSYDLLLTEIAPSDPDRHHFVLEIGTEAGRDVVHAIDTWPAEFDDQHEALAVTAHAASQQSRRISTATVHDDLRASAESSRWEDVASRCLSCTNCTLVCPTCFCTTVEDVSDLTGATAERHRVWDSCFSEDFTYIHGGPTRESVKARYRQWITHKLSSWEDQFGMLGCVGCGRCIAWCPAGIDITEEAAALGRMRSGGSLPHEPLPVASGIQ